VDAVVFSLRDVRIDIAHPLTMPMLGSNYELQQGISTVPEAGAVFLCRRGMAEIT
jgi:DNA primase small subunit